MFKSKYIEDITRREDMNFIFKCFKAIKENSYLQATVSFSFHCVDKSIARHFALTVSTKP